MKIKVSIISILKLCFFSMLCYSSFLMDVLEIKIPNMTLMLGVLTACVMMLDMMVVKYNFLQVVTTDVKRLLLFALLSIIGVVAVADHIYSATNGLIQLLQSTMLMIIAIYICLRDGSVTFCARTIVIIMLAAVVHVLMNMESFEQRLAISETGNANVFGHNAVLGVCMVPLAMKKDTRFKRFLLITLIALFSVGVVLSASRLSFLTLIGYFAAYLLVIVPKEERLASRFSGGVRFFGVTVLVAVFVVASIPYLADTLIMDRMADLFEVLETGEGDGQARVYLYQEAWREFVNSPVFGVGYANFGPRHFGVYTHSTYAEILSCTGITGCLSFVSYYAHILHQLRLGRKLDKKTHTLGNYHLVLVFLVLVLLGIGEILIYKIKYFVVYGMLAAQFVINKNRMEGIVPKGGEYEKN